MLRSNLTVHNTLKCHLYMLLETAHDADALGNRVWKLLRPDQTYNIPLHLTNQVLTLALTLSLALALTLALALALSLTRRASCCARGWRGSCSPRCTRTRRRTSPRVRLTATARTLSEPDAHPDPDPDPDPDTLTLSLSLTLTLALKPLTLTP